jgi:MFS family permease
VSVIEEKLACEQPYETRVHFESLTSEFGLYCDKGYLKNKYLFYLMLIASFLTLLFSMIQDAFGRKKMIMLNTLLLLFGFIFVYFGSNKEVKLCGFMLMWGFSEILFSCLFILSNELFVNPFRNYSSVCFSIATMIGGLIGNLVTLIITDYYTFVLFIFIGFSFSILLFMIFVPESPYFLHKNNDKSNFERFVRNVAEFNGVPEDKLSELLKSLEHLNQSKASS